MKLLESPCFIKNVRLSFVVFLCQIVIVRVNFWFFRQNVVLVPIKIGYWVFESAPNFHSNETIHRMCWKRVACLILWFSQSSNCQIPFVPFVCTYSTISTFSNACLMCANTMQDFGKIWLLNFSSLIPLFQYCIGIKF